MKSKSAMKLLWASDIHLDRAGGECKERFFERLAAAGHDGVVISGDISNSKCVVQHLEEIGRACNGSGNGSGKPVYFVLGNHDYYQGSIRQVESAVDQLCQRSGNLFHLGKGEIISIGNDTALMGHRGWGNGGEKSRYRISVPNPDRHAIADFCGLSNHAYFSRVQSLGAESADYVRRILPAALARYSRVVHLTHYPVHTDAIRFNERPCGWDRMGHFANFAMGGAMLGISKNYQERTNQERTIMVLAGHSHCAATVRVAPGIEIKVAGARPGKPEVQGIIDVALL